MEPGGGLDFFKAFTDYIWIPLMGIIGYLWQRINGDIKAARAVAEASVPRAEFDGYIARMEKNRTETRETNIAMFEKLDKHAEADIRAQERLADALADQTKILIDKIDLLRDRVNINVKS